MARRPHPGQAVLLCRRGGHTDRRPPGRPVRGRHRRGPGHPRRSSRHRDGWGMASRHRRRCFSGMHRRRRADRGGTAGTGQTALKVAEGGNAPRPRSCDAGCEDPRADQGTRDSGHGEGISCTTSAGFLSRRRPWNLGWRSRPSAVRDWYVWSQAEPPDRFEGMMFPALRTKRGPTSKPTRGTGTASTASSPISIPTIRRSGRRREEIRKVALFWVGLGVTGFRNNKVLSQAGDVFTGPHGEASEENPGNVGPRPRVSRAAGRPGLHLHELPDLLMWPRGRAASLAL